MERNTSSSSSTTTSSERQTIGFIGLGAHGRAVAGRLAGAGNGAVLEAKRDKILREDYAPLFTAAAVKEFFALAFPRGLEERDVSAIFPILRGGAPPPGP